LQNLEKKTHFNNKNLTGLQYTTPEIEYYGCGKENVDANSNRDLYPWLVEIVVDNAIIEKTCYGVLISDYDILTCEYVPANLWSKLNIIFLPISRILRQGLQVGRQGAGRAEIWVCKQYNAL
jgi:hypothetical protein